MTPRFLSPLGAYGPSKHSEDTSTPCNHNDDGHQNALESQCWRLKMVLQMVFMFEHATRLIMSATSC
jgi:hypothetical protein